MEKISKMKGKKKKKRSMLKKSDETKDEKEKKTSDVLIFHQFSLSFTFLFNLMIMKYRK